LRHCVLSGANLADADLRGSDLATSNLSGANLCGADLGTARLESGTLLWFPGCSAGLRAALYDRDTRWPAGFDPDAHGARLDALPKPMPLPAGMIYFPDEIRLSGAGSLARSAQEGGLLSGSAA
jgi:hypothetical protein